MDSLVPGAMNDSTRSTESKRRPSSGSAGILLFRRTDDGLRVLLAHPGGPYFAGKETGAWTIPKGLIEPEETAAAAARREFAEETGWSPPGELTPLGEIRLRSGKRVIAFAVETADQEAEVLARFSPGTFCMEWPPRSGRWLDFPEVDRIGFFDTREALQKINLAQAPLIDRLTDLVSGPTGLDLPPEAFRAP